jgi:phosphoglycerate dehydrogenase-like enzyme
MSGRHAIAACLALLPLLVAGPARAAAVPPDPAVAGMIAELGLRESPVASRDQPGWTARPRVLVLRADAERLEALRRVAPGAEVTVLSADPGQRAGQLARAQAILATCDPALLAAPRLHWFQSFQVGVERCVAVPGLQERGIVLTNGQRTSGPPIAEHAIAMMMSLARGLPQYGRHQQAGEWNREGFGRARELKGRTLLVVGLGGIGTEVAWRGHGLGMRVIATRNSSREGPDFVARVGLPDELLALAAEADVVVNAAPITPATTGIFDARFFAAMKPGGYFINVARGRSVVQDDLVAALRSGQLGGAGLDVTDPEPLPAGHPLWAMDNVIITPHIAGDSDREDARQWLLVTENLRRYAAGEPLLNAVDIARGY